MPLLGPGQEGAGGLGGEPLAALPGGDRVAQRETLGGRRSSPQYPATAPESRRTMAHGLSVAPPVWGPNQAGSAMSARAAASLARSRRSRNRGVTASHSPPSAGPRKLVIAASQQWGRSMCAM